MALEVGTLNARVTVDTAGVASSLGKVKRDLTDVKKSADQVSRTKLNVTPVGTGAVGKASREARSLGTALEGAGRAGRGVQFNPQVANELDKATKTGISLRDVLGSMSSVAGMVGLGAAVGGVSAAFNDMLQTGMVYRKELNTMSAVSGATAEQMNQISQAAKQLGNDNDLAATSAGDAAAAMTELAKGGFTVDQAIGAAKGTLQLAAAAQVDAATAATIQSQALQAFSLDASNAARVSDILAGAANASSAEMTGIAQGMQQAGTVANQFGLSVDDTATSLAMMANAGIQGSDAGTLLKTALLSLTDQGKPAQAAIDELGLSIYDANGKFVGMQSLMEQLQDASESMTAEQYQAATATLFGSDAMRLAGIAAQQGGEGFDKLRGAVTRQGQAAEVAAAQTQGLPGAIGRVENAWETASTTIFEKSEGVIVKALDGVTAGIEAVGGAISGEGFTGGAAVVENLAGQVKLLASGAKDAGDATTGALVPGATDMASAMGQAGKAVGAVDEALSGWAAPLAAAGIVGLAANMSGLTGKMNAGSQSVMRFGQEMRVQQALAAKYGQNLGMAGSAMAVMRSRSVALDAAMTKASAAYMRSSAGLRVVASSHQAAARASRAQAMATSSGFMAADRIIAQAGHGFVATTARMGASAKGLAGGGLSLLKSSLGGVKAAAGGLMGALGGPWGIAIMGASAAIGFLVQKNQEAKEAAEKHAKLQRDLKDTLDKTTGAITEQTGALIENQLAESGALDKAKELNLSSQTMIDSALGNADAQARVKAATDGALKSAIESTSAWERVGGALEAAGYTSLDLADAMGGNREKMAQLTEVTGFMHKETRELENAVAGTRGKYGELIDSVNGANDALADASSEQMQIKLEALQVSAKQTKGVMDALGDAVYKIEDDKTISVSADAVTEETRLKMEKLGVKVSEPMNGRVSITMEKGADIPALLDQIGIKLQQTPNGYIRVNSDDINKAKSDLDAMNLKTMTLKDGSLAINTNAPEVLERLVQLGLAKKDHSGKVTIDWSSIQNSTSRMDALRGNVENGAKGHANVTDNTGKTNENVNNMRGNVQAGAKGHVSISDNAEATRSHIKSTLSAENTNTFSDHVINITRKIRDIFTRENADGNYYPTVQAFADGGDTGVQRAVERRMRGGAEPAHTAHIAPAGAYRVFAENETGGEAYIPLAESKRGRSEKILAQVANKFGYQLMDANGQVQAFASGGVVDSITGLVQRHFPGMTITSTYRNTNDLHGQGKAVDVSNGFDTTPEMQALARWFYKNFKNQLAELIHYPLNGWKNVDEGKDFDFGEPTNSQHRNHVHIAAHQPLAAPAPKLGKEGLDDYKDLDGAVGGKKPKPTPPRATSTENATMGAIDAGTAAVQQREINGGKGTLLEDGSFLELMASLYSVHTGKPVADDIVSWGQVVGLHSKAVDDGQVAEVAQAAQETAKSSKQLGDVAKQLKAGGHDDLAGVLAPTDSLPKVDGNSGNRYADAIIREGRRRGITDRGIKIALATALVESNMKMYANHADPASLKYPHDAVGSDHDSVGLFQQRANGAWGTVADRMDPARSAGMFYDKLDDADYNTGDPGAHAQRVQVSAFPDRYNTRMGEAQALLDKYNGKTRKVKAMADGGILGGLRQAHINDGSSAVLWAEAGPEAYIPLSSDKKARSLDIWAETGKRLGVDVLSMMNFIGSGIPALMQGKLDFNTGGSTSLSALGLNMDAAAYRGGKAVEPHAQRAGQQAGQAVGAVFNGPVTIQDPKKYLHGQLNNAERQLKHAIRSVMP
ncbi:phage tail tape measure protein [Corynebacterium incognita]|uniref:Phage tail tape measure protein n=1 Tax=Corynebacterium incognita TaxID=2754725 RepID=A0A7G7CRN7_9CORY|nr:phage tail tape measure protein [Corynebacterium incognita]QNE90253.1 phage tail tape measure protein [Corynebacterium incognita]